jgi:hypothetical protein
MLNYLPFDLLQQQRSMSGLSASLQLMLNAICKLYILYTSNAALQLHLLGELPHPLLPFINQ